MPDITKAEAARLRADADGRFTLVVLRPADIAGLIEAADGGDVVAWQTLRTGNAFIERCRAGATFCSCCGAGLAGKTPPPSAYTARAATMRARRSRSACVVTARWGGPSKRSAPSRSRAVWRLP